MRVAQASKYVCVITLLLMIGASSMWAQTATTKSASQLPPRLGSQLSTHPLTQQNLKTVVLTMAGDSVAVVRSRMLGKQLAQSDRQAVVRDLRNRQDSITPAIQALGGRVLAKYQHALNGIKVQATPDQIANLARLPGVVGVKSVRTYHLTNAESVPFIGAPAVWQGPPGLHGEHIKVASIDTGIDYTHANFGGPGTVAAFNAAAATSTLPADPTLFGPSAPKVKGGIDLVGDAYDADDPTSVPVPDPNPLDCNGHGSHTAGTLAGFGVTAAGNTFHGPYDSTTPSQSFIIGPGVAPLADLYAVRVFGCAGSTNVVVDGIDWAIANDMQVISMSLGAPFGTEDDADSEASENAVESGIVVVASAGNSGDIPYITGDPSTGNKVISVAAMDSHQFLAGGIHITFSSGFGVDGVDANTNLPLPSGSVPAVILTTGSPKTLALGCSASDYPASGAAGALVIVSRGTCTFVQKATLATAAGAVAIGVVNNSSGFYNPAITGVTIPFIELQQSDAPTLAAAPSPETATIAFANVANATFRQFASFTSAGPRMLDGHLKPDLTAPGVNIFSTAIGTGNQGLFESGTSMSAPHVAGSAALAIQAHPSWSANEVATALINTGDSSQLVGFTEQLGGNGLVQPFPATRTSVIARASHNSPTVNFGVQEFTQNFRDEKEIHVKNLDHTWASFSLSVDPGPGAPHNATVEPKSISLGPHEEQDVKVKLSVPVATVGDSTEFRQVEGQIKFTPIHGNGGAALAVPYYMVARARSLVDAHLHGHGDPTSRTVFLDNNSKSITGTADFYSWGLHGENSQLGSLGLRAIGVQSFDGGPGLGQVLVFAVNVYAPWSNPSTNVYDIFIDVNGDGTPDYDVEVADLGILEGTGSFTGQMVTAAFNLSTGAGFLEFLATAPTNGDTILLPVVAADVGVTAANPRFSYAADSFDWLDSNVDIISTFAPFNAFNSSISTGAFATLPPDTTASVPITINPTEFAITPALGVMVVSMENLTEDHKQALLLRLHDDH